MYMLLTCLVCSAYPLFAIHMPGFLKGQSFDFLTTARLYSMGTTGILGIPLYTVSTLLIGFMVFGVVLQNTVPVHQFGIAIGTMNFTRNLYGTFLIAVFGAVVLAGPEGAGIGAGALADDPAHGFAIILAIAAASLVGALISLALLEQKPLRSTLPPQ